MNRTEADVTQRRARCERLWRVMADREQVLREEVQRRALACRQLEVELAVLQEPAPRPAAATAAWHCQWQRHEAQREGERLALETQLEAAAEFAAAAQASLREAAQTRRTVERLRGRLRATEQARWRRYEQLYADDNAQRHPPE